MSARANTARLGLLAAAVVLVCVLVVSSGWSWSNIRAERSSFAAAQADQIQAELVPCLREQGLDACVVGVAGLRWAQVDDPREDTPLSLGEDRWPGVSPERGQLVLLLDDGFVRARVPLPPDGGPPPRRGEPPPALLFDFRPLFAEGLEQRAMYAFVLSTLVGVGLLVATILLNRSWKRAEAAEAEAARNRNLAAMGTMSAVLAHEIRNPITVLLGNAQLLAEEYDNEEVRHLVEGARRLRTLTEDLLSFARTGELDRRATDPRMPALAALGDRGTLNAAQAPATWSLDAARVEQLLGDLVENAPTPVELGIHVESGTLVYTVRDHGAGLPPGDPEQLFAPFFTTRAQGTGLGLAVVRRLAEAHGGSVTAGNHPDGGAIFTVRIPGAP